MYPGMERGTGRNHRESLLDHLPEVVFFAGLHRDGLDLCAGLPADRAGTSEKRLSLAADRAGFIYTAGGIIYALKLPIFNAKHKISVRMRFPSVCHGRKPVPLCDDVRICSIRVKYPFRLTGIMPHTYTKCIHSIFLCHIHSPFKKGTVLMPADRLTQAVPFQFIKSV